MCSRFVVDSGLFARIESAMMSKITSDKPKSRVKNIYSVNFNTHSQLTIVNYLLSLHRKGCSNGGIGRHEGLKILWPVMAVRVQVPLAVLKGKPYGTYACINVL